MRGKEKKKGGGERREEGDGRDGTAWSGNEVALVASCGEHARRRGGWLAGLDEDGRARALVQRRQGIDGLGWLRAPVGLIGRDPELDLMGRRLRWLVRR